MSTPSNEKENSEVEEIEVDEIIERIEKLESRIEELYEQITSHAKDLESIAEWIEEQ